MVARRLAGYPVAMEIARRPEGTEVNGDRRKTVSRRSLIPSLKLKGKSYSIAKFFEYYYVYHNPSHLLPTQTDLAYALMPGQPPALCKATSRTFFVRPYIVRSLQVVGCGTSNKLHSDNGMGCLE